MAARKKIAKKARSIKIAPRESSVETLDVKSKSKKIFKKRNILIILVIVLTFTILYYFKGLFVAALVNGEPIARLSIVQELEKRGGEQTLSSLVTKTLILQEAGKQGVDVAESEINDEIKKIEDNLKKQGQSLDDALGFQGLTKEDFIEQIRIQKLIEKMLAKDIKVTDKEVSDYIEQNKGTIPIDITTTDATISARQQLEQQKLGSKAQEWIAELQEKAKIQYFVNY